MPLKTPQEIREQIQKVKEEIFLANERIKLLQTQCLHPNTETRHCFGSEYETECEDCGKIIDW